jgi:hypothetical protein
MALSSVTGCLSVGIQSLGPPSPGVESGSLQVSVSQHRLRDGNGAAPEHPFIAELSRVDGREPIAIRESSESRWSIDGLAPGKYRIRVASFVDDGGKTRPLSSPIQKTFRIRPGETVSAEIVAKRFPTGTVVALGAAAAGGLLIAAIASAAGHWGGRSIGTIDISGKSTQKKLLHGQPMPAPRVAPMPSAPLP